MPLVASTLSRRDRLGTLGARSGFLRNSYKITPGLYGLGNPTAESPVLVTANYKLTFDNVRSSLPCLNAWLLVVDTRGINVWCGAGKGTFSSEEIIYQVERERLAEVVSHRTLILPQLAAVGVAARKIKKGCAFHAIFGPVRIGDLPRFLEADGQADEAMRSVTFTLRERSALIPVEVCMLWKPLLFTFPVIALCSGFGPGFYSPGLAVSRALLFLLATLVAILAGAVVAPLCLPWLPGRQFWLKGVLAGVPAALLVVAPTAARLGWVSALGLCCWTVAAGSYLAMNFTGSTPFTSLTGVEQEMRRGLPVQILATIAAVVFWFAGPFYS